MHFWLRVQQVRQNKVNANSLCSKTALNHWQLISCRYFALVFFWLLWYFCYRRTMWVYKLLLNWLLSCATCTHGICEPLCLTTKFQLMSLHFPLALLDQLPYTAKKLDCLCPSCAICGLVSRATNLPPCSSFIPLMIEPIYM